MSLLNGSLTMAGAINHATATGATNTYLIALDPPLPVGGYLSGLFIIFIANAPNTGACTVNVNGRGAKNMKKRVAGVLTDLAANDIGTGQPVFAMYDGTDFEVPSIGSPGGTGTVTVSGSPTNGQATEWTSVSSIQGVAVTGTGSYMKATSPTPVLPIHVAPIVQPSTPTGGLAELYVDSTSKNLAVISDAGVVNHGVRTKAVVSNEFLTGLNDAGLVTGAQPAFTNISGAILTAQITDANVTLAKLVSIATASLLGRNTAGTGVPEVLSAATAKTLLALDQVNNVGNATTATLTNKRITKRSATTTSSATPTINTDAVDFYHLTAQAVDITSFTTNLSGTPTEGQTLWIAITGTASRLLAWGASFEASTVALPTTTVGTNRLDVGFIRNTVTSRWRCIAVG